MIHFKLLYNFPKNVSNVGLFAHLTIIDRDIFSLATALATHFNTLHYYYYYKINMNEYFLKIPKRKEAHPSIQESTNHRPWLIELASCSIEQSNHSLVYTSLLS